MFISIIWFIVILSVVVIAHEFGHFIIARTNGIHVVEFSVGMGPKLFSFTKGETIFSLRLLPLGGACIFEGEDGLEEAKIKKEEEETGTVVERSGKSFREANVWARIATVFAGPFFNFILSFIFAMIIVSNSLVDLPVIQGLTEGRAAIDSGLMVGDTITKLNGESIHLWRDITLVSLLNTGEEITVEYDRNGTKGVVSFVPTYSEEEERYFLGIEGGTTYIKCKGLDIFEYSWYELVFNFRNTLKGLKQMILGKLSMDNLSGPVGIAQAVDETYDSVKEYGASMIVLNMMNIAMLLSVSLGVMNLLPIPALDGGRLVFLIIEVFRGKPVPAEKEGIIHLIGIVLLFLLMIFVLFNDVARLFGR